MVWWHITWWPKYTIWTNLKYTIHKLWSTIVWPKLPKFITNSKLLKIFWNLHLWHHQCQLLSMKKINLKKQHFYTNHSQSFEVPCESIMYTHQPQLVTSRPCINWPTIVQMTSNLAQEGAQSNICEMMLFAPCHANLVFF